VFVETLGDAVEARRCLRLYECLADPQPPHHPQGPPLDL